MTLATVGFRLCLGGEAPVGQVCGPPVVDDRQIFEDWFGGGSKFASQNEDGVIIDADAASFGGRFRVTPDPNRSGWALSNIKTHDCLDLTGMTVVVRAGKIQPSPSYNALILETVPGSGTHDVYVEILGRSGSADDLDASIFGTKGDSTFETQRLTYDPAAHAWWRIRHDDTTGTLDISVSAFCEDWDVLVSAGADESKFRAQHLLMVQEVQQGPGSGEEPGYWSEIYIYPTTPEEEEPES